ncbi:hypothetical protein PO768_14880, partial [Paucibacter sp. XJ19-41]|nr:hypothetical protein [Paucibacter sp. XJ19-41]
RLGADGAVLASPLPAGRRVYLHLVTGAASLALEGQDHAEQLRAGDALAWPRSAGFSLRASGGEAAELLLIDLQP